VESCVVYALTALIVCRTNKPDASGKSMSVCGFLIVLALVRGRS